MELNTNAAVEITTKCSVTVVVHETIEDAFTAGNDERKEEVKTSIRSMMEGDLIVIVGQGLLDNTLVRFMDMLVKSTALWTFWCHEL